MNVTDPLSISKFAADCQDILITEAEQSQAFMLMKGGTIILQETYNYDTDGNIRIAGLAQILSQTLYGDLKTGEQAHARDTFGFYLGEDRLFGSDKTVYAMRLQNPNDPDGEKEILSVAHNGACVPGHPHLITVIGPKSVRLMSGSTTLGSVYIGDIGKVMTADCDPAQLFPSGYRNGDAIVIEDVSTPAAESVRRRIQQPCDDMVTVRFLNRYDMPECVTARYMTEKPTAQDDVSMMHGRRVRFSVKSSTEYTLASGKLDYPEQFDTWQDLLTSRKAQILWQGEWIDIIITKSNYTRHRRRFHSSQVEISFQTANPYMTL